MYVDAMPVSYVKYMFSVLQKYVSCRIAVLLKLYFVYMLNMVYVKAMYSNEFWSELMTLKWNSF